MCPSPPTRALPKLLAGEIDLECGSTTDTVARAKTIAFSPVFFLAGTKLMTAKDSAVTSYRDVKSVAVSVGTTNAAVLKALAAQTTPPFAVIETPRHPRRLRHAGGGHRRRHRIRRRAVWPV